MNGDLAPAGAVSDVEVPLEGSGENHSGRVAPPAHEEELAAIQIGATQVAFERWGTGSDALVALRVSGPTAAGNPLAALTRDARDLTMLETFLALAPGRDAPEALIESHPGEAAALGRLDDGVLEVEVVVEKISPPAGVDPCDDSLFFPPPLVWSNQIRTAVTFDAYLCVSEFPGGADVDLDRGQPSTGDCAFSTRDRRMVGMCRNVENETEPVTAFTGFGNEGGEMALGQSVAVPPLEFINFQVPATDTPGFLAIVGLVNGQNSSFGLRSGTAR